MPLLNIPGPGEKLRQNYALNQPPGLSLAPELVPVVLVDDFSDPGASGRDAVAFISVTAVAGQTPRIVLVAPADSSRRYIIRRIYCRTNTIDVVQFAWALNVTGAVEQLTRQWKDPRGVSPGRPSLFTGGESSGTLAVTDSRPFTNIGAESGYSSGPGIAEWNEPGLVLTAQPPAGTNFFGRTLVLSTFVPAQGLHVNVEWNELDMKA